MAREMKAETRRLVEALWTRGTATVDVSDPSKMDAARQKLRRAAGYLSVHRGGDTVAASINTASSPDGAWAIGSLLLHPGDVVRFQSQDGMRMPPFRSEPSPEVQPEPVEVPPDKGGHSPLYCHGENPVTGRACRGTIDVRRVEVHIPRRHNERVWLQFGGEVWEARCNRCEHLYYEGQDADDALDAAKKWSTYKFK